MVYLAKAAEGAKNFLLYLVFFVFCRENRLFHNCNYSNSASHPATSSRCSASVMLPRQVCRLILASARNAASFCACPNMQMRAVDTVSGWDRARLRARLHYKPAAVDEIIRLTRCQPLLVQLLCQELVHLLNERGEHEATVVDIEAVIPRAFASGSSLYFDYLQKDAGPIGDTMLRNLAQAGPGASVPQAQLTGGQIAHEQALKRLLQRDLGSVQK